MSVNSTTERLGRLKVSGSLPPVIEHQRQRLQTLQRLIRLVGAANTGRAIRGRMLDRTKHIEIEVDHIAQLRQPLVLTTAPSDIINLMEVFKEESYDLPEYLDKEINGKPIVDLGAYIGIASARFASRYPDSEVRAIEPHPRNYALLARNALVYGGQIETINAAVAPDERPVTMSVFGGKETNYWANGFLVADDDKAPPKSAGISSITPGGVLETLDDTDEIGLLKVDIEGSERELFGAESIKPLLARSALLLVESHDRFVPGCSQAIQRATEASRMRLDSSNDHTLRYVR